ncbi:MAG: MFS transporter [Myxococcaceae bacterium]|nr:MFS transporter [Myxococcaceae bacterium]
MVMPLGRDFALALDFSEAHIGYIAGAYTASACVAGLIGARFLDRLDRKTALCLAMIGLATGTAIGGLAVGFETLVAARLVAGAFGGPATAIAIAIVSDVVPAQLRGRALGLVMGAFSIASVLGVPAGLWVGEQAGWRAPFFAVGALGLVVTLVAFLLLPAMRGHLERKVEHPVTTFELVSRPIVFVTYGMTALTMMAGFVLIPNISGYLQMNLDYPRGHIDQLYLFGGLASVVSMQAAGWLVDRFGSFRTSIGGTAIVVSVMWAGFFEVPPLVSPLVMFIGFMTGMALRNVSYSTLNTKVPEPEVRARYQSLSSAVQHGASAFAAFVSAQLLGRVPRVPQVPGKSEYLLEGMHRVAGLAMALTLLIPLLLWWLEGQLQRRGDGLMPKPVVR